MPKRTKVKPPAEAAPNSPSPVFEPDPALYHRMAKPRPIAEVKSAIDAFDADVKAAREKHGIANVLILASAFVEGHETPATAVACCGDMANVAALGVHAFRWAREQHVAMFNRAAGVERDGE